VDFRIPNASPTGARSRPAKEKARLRGLFFGGDGVRSFFVSSRVSKNQ